MKKKYCNFCFKYFNKVKPIKNTDYHACQKCLQKIKLGEIKIDWEAQGFKRNPIECHQGNGEDGLGGF